jgi:hypothetical protein
MPSRCLAARYQSGCCWLLSLFVSYHLCVYVRWRCVWVYVGRKNWRVCTDASRYEDSVTRQDLLLQRSESMGLGCPTSKGTFHQWSLLTIGCHCLFDHISFNLYIRCTVCDGCPTRIGKRQLHLFYFVSRNNSDVYTHCTIL